MANELPPNCPLVIAFTCLCPVRYPCESPGSRLCAGVFNHQDWRRSRSKNDEMPVEQLADPSSSSW